MGPGMKMDSSVGGASAVLTDHVWLFLGSSGGGGSGEGKCWSQALCSRRWLCDRWRAGQE